MTLEESICENPPIEAIKMLEDISFDLSYSCKESFFVAMFMTMEKAWIKNNPQFPTACTNGLKIYIDVDFFLKNTYEENKGLLLHEAMHPVFDHLERMNKRHPEIWNIACDITINSMLLEKKFELPKEGIVDIKHNKDSLVVNLATTENPVILEMKGDSTTEEIYGGLLDLINQEKQKQNNSDLEYDFQGDMAEGESLNGDKSASAKEIQAQKEEITQVVNQAVQIAKMQSKEGDIGSIPSHLKSLLEHFGAPKLNWREILLNYMSDYDQSDWSFLRPNKYLIDEGYFPTLYSQGSGKIGVYTDSSGSVTKKQHQELVSEGVAIQTIANPSEIYFCCWDWDVKEKISFAKNDIIEPEQVPLIGGGGTNIDPVLEHIKLEKPEVAVILTDGYFNKPTQKLVDELPCDIIWILFDGKPNFNVGFGVVIEMH